MQSVPGARDGTFHRATALNQLTYRGDGAHSATVASVAATWRIKDKGGQCLSTHHGYFKHSKNVSLWECQYAVDQVFRIRFFVDIRKKV